MSIADKLSYLNDTKTAIKQAIQNKGVTVSDADTFRSYADKIEEIKGSSGGSGTVVEKIENFTVVGTDVWIINNSLVGGFSTTSWIEAESPSDVNSIVTLITKLMLSDRVTKQTSFFDFTHIMDGTVGVYEDSSRNSGVISIKENTWYWVQVVRNPETNSYTQYILEDNEQIQTLDSLPNVSEWMINIKDGTKSNLNAYNNLIVIGNNLVPYNTHYIRGVFDLNGTKIVYEDGTVWTPYTEVEKPTVSGDTAWAYYNDSSSSAGDKVMLTKVNSLVTPDSAFCNGFRPDLILDGYAYVRVGEQTTTGNSAQRRQIVNGVIDSDNYVTISSYNSGYNWALHYCLKGTRCILLNMYDSAFIQNGGVVRFVKDTTMSTLSPGLGRFFLLENLFARMTGSGTGVPYVYDYSTLSGSNWGISKYASNLAWEDGTSDCFYTIAGGSGNANWTTSLVFRRNTLSTKVSEDVTPIPSIVVTGTSQATDSNGIFIQTKDYKYLLHSGGYVDVTLKDNTITINDYPDVIVNEIGDRSIRQMQVFYDGYFSIQLDDGTTLMCKYDNDMSDVRIDEVVEPIYVEGDDKVYIRSYSADRFYWWQLPVYRNKRHEVMPLANNPAGPYKAKEATSDYVAFKPSKDRFNSTVLTGFLTGSYKDEDGRQMVEVATVIS